MGPYGLVAQLYNRPLTKDEAVKSDEVRHTELIMWKIDSAVCNTSCEEQQNNVNISRDISASKSPHVCVTSVDKPVGQYFCCNSGQLCIPKSLRDRLNGPAVQPLGNRNRNPGNGAINMQGSFAYVALGVLCLANWPKNV